MNPNEYVEPCTCGEPEVWLPCPDTRKYKISNHGGLWFPGYRKCQKPYRANGCMNYKVTDVTDHPRRQRAFGVHRLVMKAFRGPTPDGMEIAHLDGDITNNHLDNLRFVTKSENEMHKLNHGTMVHGEKQPLSKLTWDDVRWMRGHYRKGCLKYGAIGMGVRFGVSRETIRRVINRKTWKHDPEFDVWYDALMAKVVRMGVGEMVQDKDSFLDYYDDGYDPDEAFNENASYAY